MVDTRDFAARTALVPIQTLTLTDRQFLTGDRNGKQKSERPQSL